MHYIKIMNKIKVHYRSIFRGRRNRLLALGVVVIFLGGLVFASLKLFKETEAAWFDDTYTYRFRDSFVHDTNITDNRAVTYTFDNAELITANLLQSDCDDIRFTDGNGKLLLHDLTSTCNSATATYEIIFPSVINGTNVFYVYYGNPTATNAEIDSTSYTALTPSGGDPSEAAPTAADEQGPAPLLYYSFDEGTDNTCSGGTNDACNGGASRTTLDGAQTGMTTPSATSGWQQEDQCVSGKCLRFDGSDDVVAAASSETVTDDMGAMTISAWIKPDTMGEGGADGRIVDKTTGDFVNGWILHTSGSVPTIEFFVDYAGNDLYKTAALNSIILNRWNHVTVTWDGSTSASNIHIYVDGKEVGTYASQDGTSTRNSDSTAAIRVGNDPTGAHTFDGTMDELKIYNFVKTASQIKADFASRGASKGTSAQFGPDQKWLSDGLVGYWKMESIGATFGETSSSGGDDTGNGGLLLAQSATLGEDNTLVSLSFYVNTAVGDLQLGIYTDSSGTPGTLLTSTSTFTPTTGWNTQSVTPTALTAGTYWLAYEPQNNGLHFPFFSGAGSYCYKSNTFGSMPSSFGGCTGGSGTGRWSFYGTINQSDASGNSYGLTNNNVATYLGGKFGEGSEHVPASSQYFSTASTISGVKTVSFWTNPDSTTNYYLSLTSGAYITSSSGTLSASGFTNPKIYVNGVETTTIAANVWSLVTVTTDTAINADTFYIGRQGSNYFDGTLDEVRLYNRPFSPSEIAQLYSFGPGPVGYWKMD